MSCAHVTDPVLIDFYVRHLELTCARCWLALADTSPPRLAHTARRTSAGRAGRPRRDPAAPLLASGKGARC